MSDSMYAYAFDPARTDSVPAVWIVDDDRSIRRTLALLKGLCDVRRLNRRVVQVNIGDGNLNVLRA